jgi:hypothetical protein
MYYFIAETDQETLFDTVAASRRRLGECVWNHFLNWEDVLETLEDTAQNRVVAAADEGQYAEALALYLQHRPDGPVTIRCREAEAARRFSPGPIIADALAEASIRGFSGDCGAAAKAINTVFFDREGTIAVAINPHVQGEIPSCRKTPPYIGHVACRAPTGTLWDANGHIRREDLRGWGSHRPGESARGLPAHDRGAVSGRPDY